MRHFLLSFLVCCSLSWGNATVLFMTTQGGALLEIDSGTGATLATNVAGISNNARGLSFGADGLYIARSNEVLVLSDDRVTLSSFANFTSETPQDMTFDSNGNLYVVTNLNVHKFNAQGNSLLTFAHGLSSATGSGNGNKGWGIAINPLNGEVFVQGGGSTSVRRFDPNTGAQVGSIGGFSGFGSSGPAFNLNGANNEFFYALNTISGVDQIRAYDQNLNFVRSFFPNHVGNPIDLEIDLATGEMYLINTVNPADKLDANGNVLFSFGTTGRGVAVSQTFNVSVVPEPGSFFLLVLGFCGLFFSRRRN